MSKYTPLDALVKAPRKSGYKKCRRILCRAGCKRAKKLPEAPDLTTYRSNSWKEHANWLHETKSTLMVVAILIATVTFGAVLNPPGGVWQDDYPPKLRPPEVNETEYSRWRRQIFRNRADHYAGQAIMSSQNPEWYLVISSFNQVGFLASAGIILLLISGFNLQRRSLMWALMIAMWIAIGSMVVTYGLAFRCVTNLSSFIDPGVYYLYYPMIIILSVFGSLVLIGPLVVAHLVRLVIRSVKKSRRPSSPDGVAV